MRVLEHLFHNNRRWAEKIKGEDPDFFTQLTRQQTPQYLWIGCSDSRVPANQIVDLLPGQLFVHRNVANQVIHTDLNCLSVLQFAVDILQVKHVIVCGHYGCAGVLAALQGNRHGLIDNWLRHLQNLHQEHQSLLADATDLEQRGHRMCELNVVRQAINVCRTTIVEDAWLRQQELTVHGWIYDVKDGLLRDLNVCITGPDEVDSALSAALAQIRHSQVRTAIP